MASEKGAEEMRKHKARWEQAVARKERVADASFVMLEGYDVLNDDGTIKERVPAVK